MVGRAAASLVRLYQVTLGRLASGHCRFHPTCSNFAIEAFRINGFLLGAVQTVWRVLRCAPWSAGGIDHPRRIFDGPEAGPIRRALGWGPEAGRG